MPDRKRPFERSWDLNVKVFYEPHYLEELPGSTLYKQDLSYTLCKYYLSILTQPPAQIRPVSPEDGGSPTFELAEVIGVGEDFRWWLATFDSVIERPLKRIETIFPLSNPR